MSRLIVLTLLTFSLAAAPPKKPTSQPATKPLTDAESNAVVAADFGLTFRVPKKWQAMEEKPDEKKSERQAVFSYDLLGGATGTLAYAKVRIVATKNAPGTTLETWVARTKEASAKWKIKPSLITDEKSTLADQPAWLLIFEIDNEIEFIDNAGKHVQHTKAYVHHIVALAGDNVYTITFNTDGAGYKARLKQLDRVLISFAIAP